MRRIVFIVLVTFLFFLAEFVIFNVTGRWCKPDLLILPIVYFNLAWGIRYSLVSALLAGILKDSFSANLFGMYLFAFIASAYLTTLVKRYVFHMGSKSLRIFIVGIVTILNQMILYVLHSFTNDLNLVHFFIYVLAPQLIATTLLAEWTFRYLKKCVLKLSA